MANTIDFKLRTIADLKGVNELKQSLNEVRKEFTVFEHPLNMDTSEILKSIDQIELALEKAYNPNINTVNFEKFNKVLKQNGTDIQTIGKNLLNAGTSGQKAFLNLTNTFTQMGSVVKRTNKLVDEMAQTMKNTVKWGLSSGLWNQMLSSTQQAYGYIKNLDTALNDIRIVTGQSADQMRDFSKDANEAAKALAVSTRDYTEGALIYYQQGLDDDTVKALTDITAKTANVTGQSMAEVSEQLTAVWNGYNVANEAAEKGFGIYEEYVDKLAAVGAATASDLEELATAMSKVASSASMMGVNIDQLSAQVATIVSVTRQAPESVGTALKTIYARMGDLQVDGVDEFGTTLGEVSGTLESVGIRVLDETTGNLREMGTVMEEVAEKWQGWTEAQRQAIAVAMAGKRQYNNLTALFNNWNMYQDTLAVSQNAAGTLQEQQDIALESLNKKLEILRATAETIYQDLFDTEGIKDLTEDATKLLEVVDNFVKTAGGLKGILSFVAPLMLKTFSGKISESILNIANNIKDTRTNLEALKNSMPALDQFNEIAQNAYIQNPESMGGKAVADATAQLKANNQYLIENNKYLTAEDEKQINLLNKKIVAQAEMTVKYGEQVEAITKQKNNLIGLLDIDTSLEASTERRSKDLEKINTFLKIANTIEGENLGTSMTTDAFGNNQIEDAMSNLIKTDERVLPSIKEIMKSGDAFKDKWSQISTIIKEVDDKITTIDLKALKEDFKELDIQAKESAIDAKISKIKEDTDFISNIQELDLPQAEVDNFFNNLAERAKEAVRQGKALDDVLENVFKEARTQAGNLAGLEQMQGQIQKTEKGLISFREELVKAFNQKTTIQQIGQVVGSLGQLAMAINQIRNLGNIFSNDDLTLTEKVEQSFMSLAMIIPSLISVYETFIAVKESNRIATLAETAVEKVKNVVLSLSARIEAKVTVATTANTAATKLNTIEKIKNQAATHSLGLAIGIVSGAMALVTAAVIGSIALYKAHKKAVEEDAKAAENAANAAHEVTLATEEQKESVNELVSSYESLKEQYKKNNLEAFRQQVYLLCQQHGIQSAAVQALTADYEELDNIIKQVQTDSNVDIQEATSEEKAKQTASISANIVKEAGARIDSVGQGQDTLDLQGMMSRNDSEKKLAQELEKLGIIFTDSNHITVESLTKVATENNAELVKILNENPSMASKQISELLNSETISTAITNWEDAETKGKTAERENSANDIFNNKNLGSKDASYTDYQKGISAIVEKVRSTYGWKESSEEGYSKEENEKAIEDARQYAITYLTARNDALLQYSSKYEASRALIEKGYAEETVQNIMASLSDSDAKAILDNIDLVLPENAGENLQKQIDGLGDFSVLAEVRSSATVTGGVLENLEDGELTQEQIDSLFADQGIQDYFGTQEDFEKLDSSEQIAQLKIFYDTRIEKEKELTQAIEDRVNAESKANNESLTAQSQIEGMTSYSYTGYEKTQEGTIKKGEGSSVDYSGTVDETYSTAIENFETLEGALGNIKEEIESFPGLDSFLNVDDIEKATSAIEKLKEDGFDSLTDEEKNAIDIVSEVIGVNKDQIKTWKDAIDQGEDLTNVSNGLSKAQNDLNNSTEDNVDQVEVWTAVHEKAKEEMSDITGELSSIQGAYNSLNSIMDSYNENGFLTIDNLNTLLNMDDQYLAALQIQNGQMSMNQSQLETLANAQLDLAEVKAVDEAMSQLARLANDDLALAEELTGNAATSSAQKMSAAQTAVYNLAMQMQSATVDAANLANQLAEIPGLDGIFKHKDAAKVVMQSLSTKLAAIGNVRANLGKSMSAGVSKGGGGGGSSSKKEEEFTDDKVDRYWSVNKALEAINDELDKLEDKQSTMSGKQLIESLQEENKLLDQQIDKQKEKQKLQIQEAQEVQGRLKSFGVTFKDTGEITNYEAAYQAQINAYNAAVSAYNAGSLDEAGMDIAKQKYEDFKKQIERYDTLLYDEMKDVADAITEEEKKQRENTLAIFEEDYKIKLDFSEAERDMQDFLAEMEEDFTKVYEDLGKKSKNIVASFSTYQGDNGTIAADLAAIGVVEREIMNLHTTGYSGMFETISQAQDRLKELQSDLMDHAKDMKDLFQDAWDAYMDGIDQAADKFEDLMDEFDRINDNLEYQAELIELIYGEEAYDMMDKLYSAQINNSGVQIESLRQQKAFWTEQAEVAKQSYGEESEAYQEAYEKMRDCEQDLNDAVLDRINLIKDQYQNTISSTIDALEKKITGGTTLDYMQDQWDRLKESADLYMDATEKAYNTETFKANVDQAITDTKSVKAKQKLLEFQEKELKALREKKQLTQYDIDAANARFDILQKEIALEDAQNSKNTMKVTRNQEGNWTYQYVADEDDVANKRQALLDSYKELYELSKTAYQSNIENLLKLDQEYLSKKKEYLEKYGADSQEMADLDKWYQEISMGYANEAATAKSGLQEAQLGLTLEIYKQDEEAYASMTSEQQRLVKEATDNNISDFNSVYDAVRDNMNGIVDSIESSLVEGRGIWDTAADQMIDKWAGDDGSSVKAMVTDANDKLIEATQKYEEQVSDTADKAGQDFGPDGISGAIRGAEDETDNLKNKTAELASDSSSQLENLRNSVDQVKTAWEGVVQSIQDAINNIQQYLSLMQAAATASQTTFSGATNYGNYSATNSTSSNNGSGGNLSSGSGLSRGPYKLQSISIAPGGVPKMGIPQIGISMEIPSNLRNKNMINKKDRDLFIAAFNRKYPQYNVYKTGGYTGNWPMSQGDGLDSDNGRLGILHQKELVLNASDTENILDAVKIVRSMPNIISSIQNAISDVVGERLSNMTNEISQGKVVSTTAGSNKEENNVYNIVAEFPNANSAAEIEQALLNLKNIVAQKNGIRK
jgi:TP901 family phage tail tape measure protein